MLGSGQKIQTNWWLLSELEEAPFRKVVCIEDHFSKMGFPNFNQKLHRVQGGISCGAIEEASRSSKAIIEFLRQNCRNCAFSQQKLYFLIFMTKCHDISWYVMICHAMSCFVMIFMTKNSYSVLSIAIWSYPKPSCSIHSHSVLSITILLYR